MTIDAASSALTRSALPSGSGSDLQGGARDCALGTRGVAPGFSPAHAALKGGATSTPARQGGATWGLQRRAAAGASASSPETPAHRKLRKAAQDFEAILISQLLGDFKTGFSSLTGDAPLAGSDTLNSLALQAMSSALASRGGLGIGQMLVRQLEPSLNRGNPNPARAETKGR